MPGTSHNHQFSLVPLVDPRAFELQSHVTKPKANSIYFGQTMVTTIW